MWQLEVAREGCLLRPPPPWGMRASEALLGAMLLLFFSSGGPWGMCWEGGCCPPRPSGPAATGEAAPHPVPLVAIFHVLRGASQGCGPGVDPPTVKGWGGALPWLRAAVPSRFHGNFKVPLFRGRRSQSAQVANWPPHTGNAGFCGPRKTILKLLAAACPPPPVRPPVSLGKGEKPFH